ncbi:4a-hydroxytetrahydrobiopterin dehydratase [Aestuariimicrobium sp. Y1814]|uniref:4a-hydroxytetrahydrobiopterin dehydratase n=1 Tax=Aestuariimicrobium sp. Y1814 TaxID=3418742 RepID=UPI003DA7895D
MTDSSVDGLADWVQVDDSLRATFRTSDFVSGLAFVNRVGEAAEAANHHPDITLTYSLVSITTTSHDVGGLTSRDFDLARSITLIAAELGLVAD